jgi:hypothetical protein
MNAFRLFGTIYMANSYDLTISQGTTFSLSLTANDPSGNPLNLSGYSAEGGIKLKFSDTGYLTSLNPQIDSGYVSGIVSLGISASDSLTLPVTKGVYDVILTAPNGYSFRLVYGYADIFPHVS